ncbi:hypothetical protein F4778DRAFT_784410 [Xylariomycetidae sp. FL2044]|nr:hypothetical protein F4778DRAFT_784410 [Xylariomycetidae sp. FL2044]
MSAPYWGQLPTAKARRASDDIDRAGRRQSLDQPASQPQPRSNRTSIQTSTTDAPTDSTFSPLVSPARSSFQGGGLQPRPPSLPYGQNRYPSEFAEKRRKRNSQGREDLIHEAAASPPPAAPEVPKAPPVSYKDPYGNGALPYTYNASGQPGPPRSAHKFGEMEPETFYKDATPPAELSDRAPAVDRNRQSLDDRYGPARRPTNGSRHEAAMGDQASPSRRGSMGTGPQRAKWAEDRSPLQRLELKLDNITKEEKRARVEAAERRARERAAAQAGKSVEREKTAPERPNQQVRFRDRRRPPDQDEQKHPIIADPIEAQPSAATTSGTLSQHPPQESLGHGRANQSPRSQIPVATNNSLSKTERSDVPQRNLSFRERAATNDINLPRGESDESSAASPVTTPGGGLSLTRNGSNKLKKNPPGDPWYSVRTEAERRSAALNRERAKPKAPAESPASVARSTANSKSPGGTIKKKQPPMFEDLERPPARGKQFLKYDDYDDREVKPDRRRGLAAAIGLGRSNSMGGNLPLTQDLHRPPPRDWEEREYDDYDESPSRRKSLAAAMGLGRANSLGAQRQPHVKGDEPPLMTPATKTVKFPDREHEARTLEPHVSDASSHGHSLRGYIHRDKARPGHGMYEPPQYLDEWKKGTIGSLSGSLLDIEAEPAPAVDKNTPWWETGGKRRDSMSARPQKAEAFDGEYDDTQVPTRFKPPLYLKCGPLLRFCGIRHEKSLTRNSPDRDVWRGSVMIVTQDSESSYEIAPILRLFVQPIELLPPPPVELRGEQVLLPEYVDPIAGIPKLGRRGETLYVRPVEHLEEGKDVSRLEPDDGLFEITRTAPDFDTNAPDPPGSFTSRKRRIEVDGEKVGKYKDVRGFRLHTERGHTFWRFNIEVELRDKQQRIAYRINRGPTTGFWVPARGQSMNIMFHSCNGFSLSVNTDDFSGPDPMWRDVLNNHQTRPFHVMIGGGDQVYNDAVMKQTDLFQDWLDIKNPLHKNNAPFTPEMQDELEEFYLERYMMWFSQGLFGLANSQIPMVNMYDDHDIIDGFGSYPHHFMKSPVFSGLGNVAFKYYLLFQHQSLPEETEQSEPSWALGLKPGPYITELSRSLFMSLGARVSLLAVDCRTERTRDEVLREDSWKKLMDRCYDDIVKGQTQHLLVLLGVPIAYPRLVWLETILTSRLMDPIKAMGKAGMLGNFLNRFDGGVEVLDDLDDHWTAKNHKDERRFIIEDLQDLAANKSVRVTILSGDVHLAAVGQFYSHPKFHLAKHKDFRYMPNIISSAIANTPPPDLLADVLNKRNKIHHFDKETEEDMIPIFLDGVDGKPRNNKHLLPHRNWCSIREYTPGLTPPPTPLPEDDEYTQEGNPSGNRGGILRRFSLSKNRGPAYRPDVPREQTDRSRPPISGGGGGLFRSLSRRGSSSDPASRSGPGRIMRSLSLGRGDSSPFRPRNIFRRNSSADRRPDDGGINGDWGPDSQEDFYDAPPRRAATTTHRGGPVHFDGAGDHTLGLRGGAGGSEYEVGDEAYFTAKPRQRAAPAQPTAARYSRRHDDDGDGSNRGAPEFRPQPFHRTPTGLTTKQLRRGGYDVNLEGGLDVCLNVEVNPKDPAGITVPYRLLVPSLQYEYRGEEEGESESESEGLDEDDEEEEEGGEAGQAGDREKKFHTGKLVKSQPPAAPVAASRHAVTKDVGYYDDYDDDEEEDYVVNIPDDEPRGGGGGVGGGVGGGIGGGLRRWFSGKGRGEKKGGDGGGGGSQYRARRDHNYEGYD